MEAVVADERGDRIRTMCSAVTDGDWLDRCVGVAGGGQQKAVDRQHCQSRAGGAFRKHQDRLPGIQASSYLRFYSSGLAASALDEQSAGLSCEPADNWPVAHLSLGKEPQRRYAPQYGNVRPADVVGNVECMGFRGLAVHPDTEPEALAGPTEAESGPGRTVDRLSPEQVDQFQGDGQGTGARQKHQEPGKPDQ